MEFRGNMKTYAVLLSSASWVLAIIGIASVAITTPWKHSLACCLTDAVLLVAIFILAYLNERLAIHALQMANQTRWVLLKLAEATKELMEQDGVKNKK